MIKLNLRHALKSKGIEDAHKFLKQCGITYHSASKMLNNNTESINFTYLEKICLELNCTVDDLLIWIPDANNKPHESHPLYKLEHKGSNETITQKIRKLPFDKVQQINNYIDNINKQGQ